MKRDLSRINEVFRTGLSFEILQFIDCRDDFAIAITSETIFNFFFRQPFKYGQQISAMLSMMPRTETLYTSFLIGISSFRFALWFPMMGHYPGHELAMTYLKNSHMLQEKRNFDTAITYLYFQVDVFMSQVLGMTIDSFGSIDRCLKVLTTTNWEKYFGIKQKSQQKEKVRFKDVELPSTTLVSQLPLDYSHFYYVLAQLGLHSKKQFSIEDMFSMVFFQLYHMVVKQPVLAFSYDSLTQFFIFYDLMGSGMYLTDFWHFDAVRTTVNAVLNQPSEKLKLMIEETLRQSETRQRYYIHKRTYFDPFHCLSNGDDYKTIYTATEAKDYDEDIHVRKPIVRPAMTITEGKINTEDFLMEFVDTREFTRVFHPSVFQKEFEEALKAQGIAFEKNVFVWPYLFDFAIEVGEKKLFIDVEDEYKKYWNVAIYYPEERAKEMFCEKERRGFKRVSSAEFLRNRLMLKEWLATLEG